MDEKLFETLKRKALGYTAREQVTEYDAEGNETKQRITTKDVQPDMAALKMLLEMETGGEPTESELEAERERILKELGGIYKKAAKKEKK